MDEFETYVGQVARQFPYPTTPEIYTSSYARHIPYLHVARAAAAILIVILGLLVIPPIRAAIFEVLQIGSVRITVTEEVNIDDTQPAVLQDLFGEVTLEEAQSSVNFPLRLPADYGLPDRVYVQEFDYAIGDGTVVMVWYSPDSPSEIDLALYQIGTGEIVNKMLEIGVQTTINGEPALWAVGPHILQYQRDDFTNPTVLVEGSVLIWAENGVSYRLEAGDDLDRARDIAESLIVWEPESP